MRSSDPSSCAVLTSPSAPTSGLAGQSAQPCSRSLAICSQSLRCCARGTHDGKRYEAMARQADDRLKLDTVGSVANQLVCCTFCAGQFNGFRNRTSWLPKVAPWM